MAGRDAFLYTRECGVPGYLSENKYPGDQSNYPGSLLSVFLDCRELGLTHNKPFIFFVNDAGLAFE